MRIVPEKHSVIPPLIDYIEVDRIELLCVIDSARIVALQCRPSLFRIWISHRHYAAVAAGCHLPQPAALFSCCIARNPSEGFGHGRVLAADGGHGGFRRVLVDDRNSEVS